MADEDPSGLLEALSLTEYEATALGDLLALGRTTAPELSEATGIPKARIYGVLDSLADEGYVKIIPGRPKVYQPKPPEAILDRVVENRRQEYERYRQSVEDRRDRFLETFRPLYESGTEDVSPADELFYVVDVGEASERETRELYHLADERVSVMTKSFGYFESVEPAVADATDRGVAVRVLLIHPDRLTDDERARQAEIIAGIHREYPDVELRYSNDSLPWRGTYVDPSPDYSSGKAILLVDEEEVPNHLRQAAITENGSVVAGLDRYFELVWEYESAPA